MYFCTVISIFHNMNKEEFVNKIQKFIQIAIKDAKDLVNYDYNFWFNHTEVDTNILTEEDYTKCESIAKEVASKYVSDYFKSYEDDLDEVEDYELDEEFISTDFEDGLKYHISDRINKHFLKDM